MGPHRLYAGFGLDQGGLIGGLVTNRITSAPDWRKHVRSFKKRRKQSMISSRGNATLEKAIEYKMHPEALAGEIFINGNVAPYGIFVHEPTGKFAPPDKRLPSKYHRYPDGSYEIRSSRYKALRFIDKNGEEVFAKRVRHPGSKADRFLYKALETKENAAVEAFRAAVQAATREAFL